MKKLFPNLGYTQGTRSIIVRLGDRIPLDTGNYAGDGFTFHKRLNGSHLSGVFPGGLRVPQSLQVFVIVLASMDFSAM